MTLSPIKFAFEVCFYMVLSCIWFEGELGNLKFALVGEVQNLGYFGDIANEIPQPSSGC